uniref:FlgD/Vpr Ig-like domain-containing protein n=1 Tax=candidate division WOR-3 bacterium TaxID=2052148 RepID=A0A7C4CCI9_UNCW3
MFRRARHSGPAFLLFALALPVLTIAGPTGSGPAISETLPGRLVHAHSFELLANSRFSVHSGFNGELPAQVMANVLWAMEQMPRLGSYRELYVATAANVYRYNRSANRLDVHLAGDHRYSSGSAFEVGIAVPRHEECGMMVQAGLLAALAFSSDTGAQVVSCPMKWAADYANANWSPTHTILMVAVFGRAQAEGLDTMLVARSSDSTLPDPLVVGTDTFELVLEALEQDSAFAAYPLSLETVSQLLWAAYGVTPHQTYNGRAGVTVPTAVAAFHLTGRIYLVHDLGIDRYHNRRPPGTDLTTRDHRLTRIVSGDRRSDLRQSCSRIPSTAPLYFVVCVSDTASYATLQEAGFAAFQLLAQTRSLGLSGFLTIPLSPSERSAIAAALSLPAGHNPVFVFACGEAATGIGENRRRPEFVQIVRAQPAVRRGLLRVEYSLKRSGPVRAEVFDLLGRPVRLLFERSQSAGYQSLTWDGTDDSGRPVKRGSYVVVISSRGSVAQHKVTWTR